MSLLDHMPHTCAIHSRTGTKDAMGGRKDTYPVVTAEVACWRQAAKESEKVESQRRGSTITDKIYFASDPGVDEQSVIVMGSDQMSVRTAANPDASAGMGVLWRVMVEVENLW